VPFVALLWPSLAALELASAAEGTIVRVFVFEGLFVRIEGIVMKKRNFSRPFVEKHVFGSCILENS
jgi:hypothetical protein